MNEAVGRALLFVAVVAVVGTAAAKLQSLFVLVLFAVAAVHLMFKGKLPSGSWGSLAARLLGPVLLLVLWLASSFNVSHCFVKNGYAQSLASDSQKIA